MTTLQPRPPYSDSELATLYPPQLRLQLVQVLLRHGERTPVVARFQQAGLPAFWPYCSSLRQLRSAILHPESSTFSAFEWKRRLEAIGPDDAPVIATGPNAELDAICDLGMLTDRGRETTYRLGERLRHLYVDRLGFLPERIDSTDFLYLRSTPVPRALESLQQTFHGLYPPQTRASNLPAPTIISRTLPDETLFPNDYHCRRFSALSRAFAQRAADNWNDSPEVAYLNKKLGKYMPEDSPKIAVDSRLRTVGIMDSINATDAHGPETRLPKDFYDPKAREIIDKISVEEWFDGYKESQEYRTLGIGSLLGDVLFRMVGSIEQSTADGQYELMRHPTQGRSSDGEPIRFGLSGCHDTTLAAVLSSLGAFDGESWPPFTSHIAIELFCRSNQPAPSAETKPAASATTTGPKSRLASLFGFGSGSSSPAAGVPPPGIGRKPTSELSDAEKARLDGYYVRLRYNDKPVTIPGCKAPGKHLEGSESFCTLEAFKSIVDKFTPRDWRAQCRANADAPVFPLKPEPAGC